jgi:hypothetical protein
MFWDLFRERRILDNKDTRRKVENTELNSALQNQQTWL